LGYNNTINSLWEDIVRADRVLECTKATPPARKMK
jgi:hypothetical protein